MSKDVDLIDAPRGTRATALRLCDVSETRPGHDAVVDLARTVSFGELARRVAMTAWALDRAAESHGAGPALLATDEAVAFVVGALACAAAGRACVTIPTTTGAPGIVGIARSTRATALIVAGPEPRPLDGDVATITSADQDLETATPGLRALVMERDAKGLPWDDVVAYDNTSGSTGAPKVLAQRGPVAQGRRLPATHALPERQRLATNASSTSAFRARAVRTVLEGATLIGFTLGGLPPKEMISRLRATEPSILAVAPTLLRHLHRLSDRHPALPTVDEVQCIGEALRWDDVRLARELCGDSVTVQNLYGSTEVGLVSRRIIPPDEAIGEGPVPVGTAFGGRRIVIEGPDGLPCEPGTIGTIIVEGDLMTDGPAAEKLPGGGARYRTSDRGSLDASGELHLAGRSDRTVKVAGARVAAEAVEETLRGCPGVRDVVVVPVEIAPGDVRLVAHIVPEGPVDDAELRRWAAERLTPIAVPARFVQHPDGLPLLASGKVDLQGLRSSLEPGAA